MFLTQLYKYNKFLFTCLISFILLSSIVFYKWGAVATPIYQYGMFCKKFQLADTQQVYQISINNKLVDYSEFNQHDIDLTQEVIYNYVKQKKTNLEIYHTLHSFYAKLGLESIMKEEHFLNSLTDKEFVIWFASIIPRHKNVNPAELKVEQYYYLFNNQKLELITKTKVIDSLAFVN